MKAKQILAVALVCLMTINVSGIADAAEPENSKEEPQKELTEEEKKQAEEAAYQKELEAEYKSTVQSNEVKGWPEGPGTYGDAAIVMEAQTGAILYAKNIDKEEYPASITKVLTALLALEQGNLSDKVTVSPESLECLGNGYASIGLKEGDVLTLEEVLYATLLASANEAAHVVGEGVAQSRGETYDWFVEQMNQRVRELGGEHSNFVNTNGIHEENHYTCARDMALIGSALFAYPKFFEITQTPEYKIPATSTCEEHVFQQNHEMLVEGYDAYYEYAIGGKTGYTTEADNTLITFADNGEMQLVCVALKTYPGHVYSDTRALLEYGFNEFEKVSVAEEERVEGIKEIAEESSLIVPKGMEQSELSVSLSLSKEQEQEGTLLYTYKKMVVGEVSATLEHNYKKALYKETKKQEESQDNKLWKLGIVLCLAIVVILAVWIVAASFKRKKKQKMRRRRRKR